MRHPEPRKSFSSRYSDKNARGTVNDLDVAKKDVDRDFGKKWVEHDEEDVGSSSEEDDEDDDYYAPRRFSVVNDEPAIYRTVHIQRSVIKHTYLPED